VTTHKHFARSVVGLAALVAMGAFGACGSSSPVIPGGKAGSGGKAGASGAAAMGGVAGETTGTAGDTTGAAGNTGAAGDATGVAGSTTGAAGDSTGAAGAQPTYVGPSGATVMASGVKLTIPADALTTSTPITLAPTAYTPPGYTLASAVYDFGPSGTTFAQPVKVEIPLSAPTPGAHLFWSNASGGFDDIGGTVVGSTITGMVTHFSSGFAAVAVVTGQDGGAGASGADGSASGAAGSGGAAAGGGTAGSGAAGATASDGGTAADASAGGSGGGAGSGGAVDAGASIDAASLCDPYALNVPVWQPVLITDGGAAPAPSTYAGGTLSGGQYDLSGATEYGSSYNGPAVEVIIYDATAHTMRIIDRVQAVEFYTGLENVRNTDAHTLVGDVVCNTFPNQGNITQRSWSYSVGQKLVMSPVGSSYVLSYTIAVLN
jgi:hypothetical protein